MKKLLIVMVIFLLVVLVFAGCGGNGSDTTTQPGNGVVDEGDAVEEPDGGEKAFTLAELAEFDGKDGKPAYVAVDGVVYDVSDSAQWPQGDHSPCELDAAAGKDLSEVLKRAPANMRGFIESMPVVGTLEQKTTTSDQTNSGGMVFSAAELSICNGQNGNPAYVAVDGVVYDIGSSEHWHGGHHHDCPLECMAGQDLSEEITQAPAGMRASLQRFPVVGTFSP